QVAPLFTDLEASLGSDGRQHRLHALALTLPQGRLQLALGVDGAAPHALDGEGSFEGVIEGRAFAARFSAGHTLLEPHLRFDAEGEGVQAKVELEAESLAPMPLRRLHLQAAELDPAAFVEGAPRAALSLEAELAPAADGASLLVGPVRIVNRLPQAVDLGGIPLLSVDGRLEWREDAVAVDALELRLPGDGRIGGRMAWQRGAHEEGEGGAEAESSVAGADIADEGFGRVLAALELSGVDPGLLDTRLPRQLLAGRIDAEGDASSQQARVELALGRARIDIQALLQDSVQASRQTFALNARLRAVDPRAFVAEAPSARLDLDLAADGMLPVAGEPLSAA
ncbi:hypothetical protein RZS08_06710, partial [Arthrospira platensis SPKY1]|nr:hypothetical protein [Arthrospira platensis SPKY1]